MIHCGGNVWECFNGEKEGGIDYMYLSSIWTLGFFNRCCDIGIVQLGCSNILLDYI